MTNQKPLSTCAAYPLVLCLMLFVTLSSTTSCALKHPEAITIPETLTKATLDPRKPQGDYTQTEVGEYLTEYKGALAMCNRDKADIRAMVTK